MRVAVAIGCLAVVAFALPPAEEERFPARVVELVQQLDSPSELVRRAAFEELSGYGERALPLLRHFDCPSPAVAHRVERLLAPWRRLRLRLLDSEAHLPAAIGLRLHAVLRNDSRDYWRLLGSGPGDASDGTVISLDGLWLEVLGEPHSLTRIDTVTLIEELPPSGIALLRPGDELRFEIVLPPGDSPLRTGGTHRVRLGLHALAERFPAWLVGPGSMDLPVEPAWSEMAPVDEDSAPCTVVLQVRAPVEIEQALLGSDLGARQLAVLELEAREDLELLPLLRRFASRPEVRPIAVKRMGTAVLPEDYRFLERLAKRDKDAEVRRLAIDALGNYRTDDARWALMGLSNTGSNAVRIAAVGALRRHPHPQTIECFSELLGAPIWKRDQQSRSIIRNTLREWTGLDVESPADLAAFRRWWSENRESWVRDHADLIHPRDR